MLNITDKAKAYFDDDSDKILVPELPNVQGINTTYTSHLVTPAKSANIALSNAFNAENSNVQSGMKSVRQLGIESCIGAAYMLPKAWASITDNNGLITSITDKSREEVSALSQTWGSYKNNKVYSGQFQKIVVFSLASGDSCENRIEDIIDPEKGKITWIAYADTRYNGRPGCKPKWFKEHKNTALMQAIHGANWQQTPFIYNISSGAGFIAGAHDMNNTIGLYKFLNNELGSILNMAIGGFDASTKGYSMSDSGMKASEMGGGLLGPIGGIANNYLNAVSNIGYYRLELMKNRMETNHALLSNDIKFPQVPNMADYVGNAFYDLRYKLSDNDMTRFDNFLTAYGYAVDEPLKAECFSGREHFNFIQAKDVSLKISNAPQYLINGMIKQIEAGVRIWHKAPSESALINNPIVGGA